MIPSDPPEVLQRFYGELELVETIARQLRGKLRQTFIDFEDLLSEGRAGLLLAARHFEPTKDVSFRTFASYRVRGAMLDAIRQASPLSRWDYAKVRALRVASDLGEGSLGWEVPTPDPASAETALDARLALLATGVALAVVSLSTAEELPNDVDLEETVAGRELRRRVEGALPTLGTDEAEIVRRHYFEDRTLTAIAEEINLSRQWTSHLHTRALARLTKIILGRDPRRRRTRASAP